MINSKGSVVVGQQRPVGPGSYTVVMPHNRGQGQQPLQHPGDHSGLRPTPVVFEIELTLQGVVDRLDDLTEGLQEPGTRAGLLVPHGRSEQGGPVIGQERLELGAPVALVSQDHLAGTVVEEPGVGGISSR